jgi:uncharacterized protein
VTDKAGGGLARLHLPRAALIDVYGNGGFRFADMSHRGSLLCMPDEVWAWDVTDPSQINKQTLAMVFERAPDIDTLVIGTGATLAPFPAPLRDALRAASVVVDAMQTGPAIRVYNIMMGEGRRVAAGLIAVP